MRSVLGSSTQSAREQSRSPNAARSDESTVHVSLHWNSHQYMPRATNYHRDSNTFAQPQVMASRSRMTSTLPLRTNVELARAYNLTPPPDNEDIERSPTRLLHSKCLLQTHEKILEIQQRLNIAEHSYHEELLHRARSRSHNQVSCTELHDEIQHLTEELQEIGDKVDIIDGRLENIHDGVAETDSDRLDKHNELISHLDSVEDSLVVQMKSIEERWEEELEAVKKRIGAFGERIQTVEEIHLNFK